MNKPNLYIIFDQLPTSASGGLVATYVRLADLLDDSYNMKIISVFNFDPLAKEQFPHTECISLNKTKIDIRFYKLLNHLKKGEIKKFFFSLYSLLLYFFYIPFARMKTKKIVGKDKVVVTCPSAGIFMSKKLKFILEIHIYYEHFFGKTGKNRIARLQAILMRKPTLILFRNRRDSEICKEKRPKYNSDYMYNFFDNKDIVKHEKQKNKICFVGRLEDQKNIPRLLELACLLKERLPEFVLDIYGQGTLKDYTEKEIKRLNLSENVFLKGFTNDKSIYGYYSILWLTSSFEGLALVIIEASANRVSTVSSDWGPATYEVIENGKTGYICKDNQDFIEKTLNLLSDEKLNNQMSELSYVKYLELFTPECAKNKWIKILQNFDDFD